LYAVLSMHGLFCNDVSLSFVNFHVHKHSQSLTHSHFLSIPQDLFNKIAARCFDKCASRRHRDADLSLGEMSCTDRCVSKYLESQQLVGQVLQKANEQQQQQMMEMQKRMGQA
jgi:Tim10/DDP family zinc finger